MSKESFKRAGDDSASKAAGLIARILSARGRIRLELEWFKASWGACRTSSGEEFIVWGDDLTDFNFDGMDQILEELRSWLEGVGLRQVGFARAGMWWCMLVEHAAPDPFAVVVNLDGSLGRAGADEATEAIRQWLDTRYHAAGFEQVESGGDWYVIPPERSPRDGQ